MHSLIQKELLTTIAKLYYLGGMTQDEIAQKLNISRLKVCRLLKNAREFKIVQFQIATPPSYYTRLSEELQNRLAIEKVIVVEASADSNESKKNVGDAAAKYLSENIKSGMNLGVTAGSTTFYAIMQLQEMNLSDINVWQLTADLSTERFTSNGHELTKLFASRVHGTAHTLNAPFYVHNPLLKKLLLEEPEIQKCFAAFDTIDLAVVGMGSSRPEKSVSYLSKSITLELAEHLVQSGYAADICGHRICEDAPTGETLLSDRVMAIAPDQIKKAKNVVAVAAGEDKAASIIAGCRGKYINTLIIDEIAALCVLQKIVDEE